MKKNVKMIDRKKNFLFIEKKTARLERIVDRAKAKKRDFDPFRSIRLGN